VRARLKGLNAEPRQRDLETIEYLIKDKRFPIVLVDRSFLDHEFAIHAVIPIRFTRQYVIVLDPLCGRRRISRRKSAQALQRVDRWAVVWEP
jgi:hypothetical protein